MNVSHTIDGGQQKCRRLTNYGYSDDNISDDSIYEVNIYIPIDVGVLPGKHIQKQAAHKLYELVINC